MEQGPPSNLVVSGFNSNSPRKFWFKENKNLFLQAPSKKLLDEAGCQVIKP
ncbi:Hypothetical predicted protein, partial [Marmota monax]